MIHSSAYVPHNLLPMLTDPAEAWTILLLPHAGIILHLATCPTCGGLVLAQANLAVCESCGVLPRRKQITIEEVYPTIWEDFRRGYLEKETIK